MLLQLIPPLHTRITVFEVLEFPASYDVSPPKHVLENVKPATEKETPHESNSVSNDVSPPKQVV